MKTIGLLGGMSWESTDLYYQHINKMIQTQLGKLHSAKVILVSIDFSEVAALQQLGLWEQAGAYLSEQALKLEQAGADCILLCTNTMHNIADQIEASISIPLIHIVNATAQDILKQHIHKVGLLGTAFTMEQDFYKNKLVQQGIDVLIPEKQDRDTVHQIIYEELCVGIIDPTSRQKYIDIVEDLIAAGAQGIVLGCTEICMLIGDVQFSVPLFDTTSIHAKAAVDFALDRNESINELDAASTQQRT